MLCGAGTAKLTGKSHAISNTTNWHLLVVGHESAQVYLLNALIGAPLLSRLPGKMRVILRHDAASDAPRFEGATGEEAVRQRLEKFIKRVELEAEQGRDHRYRCLDVCVPLAFVALAADDAERALLASVQFESGPSAEQDCAHACITHDAVVFAMDVGKNVHIDYVAVSKLCWRRDRFVRDVTSWVEEQRVDVERALTAAAMDDNDRDELLFRAEEQRMQRAFVAAAWDDNDFDEIFALDKVESELRMANDGPLGLRFTFPTTLIELLAERVRERFSACKDAVPSAIVASDIAVSAFLETVGRVSDQNDISMVRKVALACMAKELSAFQRELASYISSSAILRMRDERAKKLRELMSETADYAALLVSASNIPDTVAIAADMEKHMRDAITDDRVADRDSIDELASRVAGLVQRAAAVGPRKPWHAISPFQEVAGQTHRRAGAAYRSHCNPFHRCHCWSLRVRCRNL